MLIFIPIKQESQRVPGKNFREFRGEQLYQHTLLKLKDFLVFVDTDSDELIETIRSDDNLNHVIPFKRKEELIGHNISVIDLLKSFVTQFSFDHDELICQLHVTTPLLKIETIKNAENIINNTKYDSIVSCNKLQSRLWRQEKYGYSPINHNPIKLEQTQDLPEIYEENSAFYMFENNVIKKYNNRIGINPYFYPINFPENLDIDTEDDWKILINIFKNETN